MSKSILLFEDKLGITTGYESIWNGLLGVTGLLPYPLHRRSTYKAYGSKFQLLVKKGNRKSPGFNPDLEVQRELRLWVTRELNNIKPMIVLCMDPALFFLMNPDWDQATPDNMRGGVYEINGIPFICMLSISAWHNKKSDKDIARLNDGYTDEEEWEEEHGGDESDTENVGAIWLEPVSVPYGKFVLRKDLDKAYRILLREIGKDSQT